LTLILIHDVDTEDKMSDVILKVLRGSVRPLIVFAAFGAVVGFFATGNRDAAEFISVAFGTPSMVWWFKARDDARRTGSD